MRVYAVLKSCRTCCSFWKFSSAKQSKVRERNTTYSRLVEICHLSGFKELVKIMSITTGFASVANCYVFKSRLQEYAQKAGFLTPVYETVKEGPSHEPCFSSSVVVDNVKYNSLPGFYNRKAAEQSAAEVALLELAKSGKIDESISCPVHETGLCKNLLQEYAQKMNYAMPSYVCRTHEAPGRKPFHSCTVDIGGIQYIGATATTKKEAELKAARTALLAIQSNTSGAESNPNGSHELTVLPCKRKAVEPDAKKETAQLIKPKKAKLKKSQKKKSLQNRIDLATGNVESSLVPQGEDTGMLETIKDGHCGEHLRSQLNGNEQVPVTDPNNNFQHAQTIPLNSNLSDQGYSNMDVDSGVQVNDLVQLEKIVDEVGVEQMATFGAAEVPFVNGEKFDSDSSLVDLLNQNEYVGNEVKVEHGVEQVATFVAAEVPGFNGENFDSDSSLVDLLNQNEYVGNEVKVEHGVEQVATFVAAEVPGFNGENFDSDNSLVGLNQTEDVGNEVKVEHGVEQVATFVAAEVPGFNGEKFDSNTSLVGLNQTEDVRSEVRVEHGVEQVATFVAAEVPGSNGEKFDSNNSLVGLNQTEDVRSEVKVEHGVEQVATVGAAEVPVVNGETLDSKHNLVGLHQNEDVCREV